MMRIHLSDSGEHIEFSEYWGDDPVAFMLRFRRIFASVSDLMLPLLPEPSESSPGQPDPAQDIEWQSTTEDFALFKQLLTEWHTVELRLALFARQRDHEDAATLLKQARQARVRFMQQPQYLPALWGDWYLLWTIHGRLDGELSQVAVPFYSSQLQHNWRQWLPEEVFVTVRQFEQRSSTREAPVQLPASPLTTSGHLE